METTKAGAPVAAQDLTRIKIGEVLQQAGYITDEQLTNALEYQKENKSKRLADILIELGYITEAQKLSALGKKLAIPLVRLKGYAVDLSAVALVPQATAIKRKAIAIGYTGNDVILAVNDPMDFFGIEEIRQLVKRPVRLCLCTGADIDAAIDYYYAEVQAKNAANRANKEVEAAREIKPVVVRDSDDAPVVKLLDSLLVKGYNSNVSDIHIEPFEEKMMVRIRVDGIIVDYMSLGVNLHQPLIARIKILSNLDIAEKRAPQDGHFRFTDDGIDVNIRVSMMPTVYGEKAVLRFLTTNTTIDNDNHFGMDDWSYARMKQMLQNPHGIVYLTGPTGSGKTTTLYMILQYLSQRPVNIATVEDPVERNIARCNQSQVNPAAGLTFESGLRSILRQDPDIIMVGETRDGETAQISVRSAITGHLVLSTLHTNDSVSSIDRLEDMGVPRHMIASSLVGVVAQRLMRKVCPSCGYEYEPDETELKTLGAVGIPGIKLRRGKGCNVCNKTGYKGRIAVHEMVMIDRGMRKLITSGASIDEMSDYAISKQGMRTLHDVALRLVLDGTTTIEEFVKTTYSIE